MSALPCPHFESPRNYTRDSRANAGRVRRRRECRDCAHRWTTYEISEQEIKALSARVERVDGFTNLLLGDSADHRAERAAMNPDLEAQIAEQRRLAEEAMAKAMRCSGIEKRYYRSIACAHYQQMAGLISKRTDERVEEMERERGLR